MQVEAMDLNGDEIVGDVTYPDMDTAVVKWFYPTAGTASITK